MTKHSLLLSAAILLFSLAGNAQGTWTPVTTIAPHTSGGFMVMLSDGTVLCKTFAGGSDGIGKKWDRLTPDANGSYANGTWSQIASMLDTRLYYSTQLLMDGRLYVAGGEYGSGDYDGEVYNPLTNVWTACPQPGQRVSDANSEILPDGRVLQALVDNSLTNTVIYDPLTNLYSAGPSCLGIHNESAWVKLPDGSILMVDRLTTNAERYIPSLNQWIADATVPVNLYDPFGDETGGAILLPDGRAFFIGAMGQNAYYTPSGNTSPGTWSVAVTLPNSTGTPDASMAMLVNGNVLCSVSPAPTGPSNIFDPPTSFYELDPIANSFTFVNAPGGQPNINEPCYTVNFVDLPNGQVLMCQQDSDRYYVYTPVGGPLNAWRPVVNNIISNNCSSFTITGTQFNGISEGASYGDDWQMSTNYPIVRLTNGPNVYYCRSFNWNSTGVARGNLPDTAKFTLPTGLPPGTYSLEVVANGIASVPVPFTPCFPVGLIEEKFVQLNMNIYPNPSTGTALISFDAPESGSYSITITDVLGKIVKVEQDNARAGKNEHSIQLDVPAKGIYTVLLESSSGSSHTKWIIE